MEHKEPKTMRIWAQTIRKLKLLAAYYGTSMVKLLDQMVDAELKTLKLKFLAAYHKLFMIQLLDRLVDLELKRLKLKLPDDK